MTAAEFDRLPVPSVLPRGIYHGKVLGPLGWLVNWVWRGKSFDDDGRAKNRILIWWLFHGELAWLLKMDPQQRVDPWMGPRSRTLLVDYSRLGIRDELRATRQASGLSVGFAGRLRLFGLSVYFTLEPTLSPSRAVRE